MNGNPPAHGGWDLLLLVLLGLSSTSVGASSRSEVRTVSAEVLAAHADSNLRAGELRPPDERGLDFYREAVDLAEQALASDANLARAHFVYFAARGRLLIASGPYRNLIALTRLKAHLDRTLEIDPDYPDALAAKGAMLLELPAFLGGDKAEGERLLRRAVAVNPNGPATRLLLAKALVTRGDLPAAREELGLVSRYASRQWRYRVLRDAEATLLQIDGALAGGRETPQPDAISRATSP